MTITGIIAEFNPFHNGHKYLLEQAEGLKIVAMSGNFMQRGEPAFVDKWTRAQMVLENGADLVVELPFLISVQSADYFADGAVAILAKLGINQLTFGTEEMIDYNQMAVTYVTKQAAMEDYLASLPDHLSYPQKSQDMWEHFTGISFSGNTPNHILGLAYAKACAVRKIKLQPIKRLGAGFHSESKSETIASATAIRLHRNDPAFVEKSVPNYDLLQACPQVSWDNYFPLLKYQVLTHSDLTKVCQVNNELASRIQSAIHSASSLEDLVDKVATKRFTKARVRRVLTYILVNAVEKPIPEAVRLLGFSQKGQEHLKGVKKSVEIISRIGKVPWDETSQRADTIYRLGHPDIIEQNLGRIPLGIEPDE